MSHVLLWAFVEAQKGVGHEDETALSLLHLLYKSRDNYHSFNPNYQLVLKAKQQNNKICKAKASGKWQLGRRKRPAIDVKLEMLAVILASDKKNTDM